MRVSINLQTNEIINNQSKLEMQTHGRTNLKQPSQLNQALFELVKV